MKIHAMVLSRAFEHQGQVKRKSTFFAAKAGGTALGFHVARRGFLAKGTPGAGKAPASSRQPRAQRALKRYEALAIFPPRSRTITQRRSSTRMA